jgi:hypothetical protein
MVKKSFLILLIIVAVAALTGCNLPGGSNATEGVVETFAPPPSLTPASITLAPTLPLTTAVPTVTPVTTTSTVDAALAPTALPAPTQIAPVTAAAGVTGTPGTQVAAAPSGPVLALNPPLGEPLDAIIVNGSGFPANAHITLHWGPVGGPHGPVYWEVDADANGSFTQDLLIPPAAKWPGGSPKERDLLQLQARSQAMKDNYVFANFTYVKRFVPETSLVLAYANQTYGYKLDLPNNWKWDDADTANVRFTAPSGGAKGFVRTLTGSDVNAAIQTVMAAEAAGQTYSSGAGSVGVNTSTQVTAANGLVVHFISSGGRIYAVSFTDGAGKFFNLIASSFRLG